jgi:hypothetical protein
MSVVSVETLPMEEPPELVAVAPSPVGRLSNAEVAEDLRRLHRLASRVEARRAELIAEADRRGIPQEKGFGSTTAWLIALTGDPPAVCRSRLAVAMSLQQMPESRTAFAAGEMAEPRVRLLAEARDLAPEQFARDQLLLVTQACSVPSRRLPQALAQWRRTTDPEGAVADTGRMFWRRALHVSPSWSGMVHLDGDLDPEGGGVVLAALRSLAEPVAPDPQDARSPAQRRADWLVEVCRRHLDAGDRPGGQRPHLTVTVAWETLEKGSGLVDTEAGPISADAVRRLACDASVSRVVLQGGSEPVEIGRSRRVVAAPLRRALDLRDGGCTHCGCDVPARWCDAHHIKHWAQGGGTEPANLRLLCRRHHREAHEHPRQPRRL